MFPTLARIAGVEVPQDRAIDGVDQSEFFLGKQERSRREGFPFYVGNILVAVKWRNWKVHFYVLDEPSDPPLKLLVPRVYDLDIDPRELRDVSLSKSWVLHPVVTIIGAFEESTKRYPLIPMGTPDPYLPPT
jgi:arylsulfatase